MKQSQSGQCQSGSDPPSAPITNNEEQITAPLSALAAFLVASVLLCVAPASASLPDDDAAKQAALQWLQILDSGNYQDAMLQMSQEVRGLRDWPNYFATRRAPLGRVNNRKIAEVKHASTVPGDPLLRPHAIIRFKTSFESKGAAMEEIVMTKMGCCWEVSGYSITAVTSDPPSRKATARQASDL